MAHALPYGSVNEGASDPAANQAESTAEKSGEQHLAWMLSKVKPGQPDRYRYLLMFRFAVVNLFATALLGAAYVQGYVDMVIAADPSNFCVAIFLVFLGGLGLAGWKVFETSWELNQVREFNPLVPSRASRYLAEIRGRSAESRSLAAAALKLKLSGRVAVVRQIGNSLVMLGLIGTVIGFIIALSGVDPSLAGDVDSISPMVSTLIAGMSVALYTTLVGSVLSLWMTVNYQILATGTISLITGIVELGERRAGS